MGTINRGLFESYCSSFDELCRMYSKCNMCEDLEKIDDPPLIGGHSTRPQHDTSPRVVVIGDYPSPYELKTRVPFSDERGQLLRTWLYWMDDKECKGMDPNDIYWTYALSCPLPRHKEYTIDLRTERMDNCRYKVESILDIVDPDMVIFVGLQVMVYYLGKEGIYHVWDYMMGSHMYKGREAYGMMHPDRLNVLQESKSKSSYVKEHQKRLVEHLVKRVFPRYNQLK